MVNENNSSSSKSNNLSDLRELKSLLDEGIITQEEFDLKKKEILGI
ncbi:SHOCT domain-containing protein [Fructobacillus fructosus]|nr:SHOCT domain-containing protein [Fructobacillus fructosus]